MTERTINEQLRDLLALTGPDSRPNLNDISAIAHSLPAITLNLKFFGYDLARRLLAELPETTGAQARHVGLASKPSTQADIESDWVAYWTGRIKAKVIYHRKIWELAYVLQAFHENGMIREGARGLGFGCGEEPLPSLLAGEGVKVTITDLAPEDDRAKVWTQTGQHTGDAGRAFRPDLVSRAVFDKNTALRFVDMNAIPSDLTGYDFCWSICSLEHLGSIENGLTFIERSLDCLRPGGVAVHTTEFNYLNDDETIDNWPTVLLQRKHFVALAERLARSGHTMAPLDFHVGDKPLDRFIDLPPWPHDFTPAMREAFAGVDSAHIKWSIDGFAVTCFGMVIRKGGGLSAS